MRLGSAPVAPPRTVSSNSPFSNSALLASGWAATAGEDYEHAVVPWTLLAERDGTEIRVHA